jgi:hypothetical protein
MAGQKPSDSRKGRKRADRPEVPSTFLPVGNPRARTGYLCAMFGLIPGFGLLLGPPAIVYGRLGYRDAKKHLEGKGIGHSFMSMLLGGMETVANGVGLPLLARGIGWI